MKQFFESKLAALAERKAAREAQRAALQKEDQSDAIEERVLRESLEHWLAERSRLAKDAPGAGKLSAGEAWARAEATLRESGQEFTIEQCYDTLREIGHAVSYKSVRSRLGKKAAGPKSDLSRVREGVFKYR